VILYSAHPAVLVATQRNRITARLALGKSVQVVSFSQMEASSALPGTSLQIPIRKPTRCAPQPHYMTRYRPECCRFLLGKGLPTHFGQTPISQCRAIFQQQCRTNIHRSRQQALSGVRGHSDKYATGHVPEAQCAFKVSMIHEVLQFALRIAFRCVLHRCGNLDIRC
jgi:hypothetical protein